MNKKTKISTYELHLVLEEVLNIEQGFAQSPNGKTGAAGKTVVTDESDEYGTF